MAGSGGLRHSNRAAAAAGAAVAVAGFGVQRNPGPPDEPSHANLLLVAQAMLDHGYEQESWLAGLEEPA